MKDEELALKLLDVLYKNNNNPVKPKVISADYKELLGLIENDRTGTVIDRIKSVYNDEKGKNGAYCDYNGIRMLTKINDIVGNKETKYVWEND